jgi:hypothetical protein
VERFVLGRNVFFFVFFAAPISKYFTHGLSRPRFLSDIWTVSSNSGFDICYGVDPTVGKIGYIHEVLARLLFIYEGLVDFEVIWF